LDRALDDLTWRHHCSSLPSSLGTPRIGPSTHGPSREVKRIILGAAAMRLFAA
jgi:hypothetical protein